MADPVYTRLDSLAALAGLFNREYVDTNEGAWIHDSGGTTGSSSTGPTGAAVGAYVFSETSSSNAGNIVENSTLTLLDAVMDLWVNEGRSFDFRGALYGVWNNASEGLRLQGKEGTANWETITTIPGAAYSTNRPVGQTFNDRGGNTREVVQVGGWVDYSVEIPIRFDAFRTQVIYTGQPTYQHDVAMYRVSLTNGDPPAGEGGGGSARRHGMALGIGIGMPFDALGAGGGGSVVGSDLVWGAETTIDWGGITVLDWPVIGP